MGAFQGVHGIAMLSTGCLCAYLTLLTVQDGIQTAFFRRPRPQDVGVFSSEESAYYVARFGRPDLKHQDVCKSYLYSNSLGALQGGASGGRRGGVVLHRHVRGLLLHEPLRRGLRQLDLQLAARWQAEQRGLRGSVGAVAESTEAPQSLLQALGQPRPDVELGRERRRSGMTWSLTDSRLHFARSHE